MEMFESEKTRSNKMQTNTISTENRIAIKRRDTGEEEKMRVQTTKSIILLFSTISSRTLWMPMLRPVSVSKPYEAF